MSVITDLIPTTLPTYHEKYRVGGYNRLGKLCYASILRRTEVSEGSWPIEVSGAGASPVTISTSYADKDFFSPVSGSSCKISMVAESYSQLLELGRGDDTMWKVEVVDDDDTIFRGFLKPETFQMEYGYEKPVVNVDATDGLGVLRNVEFAEGTDFIDYMGWESLSDIMSYLLYMAGNRVNWRDYVNYTISGHPNDNLLRNLKKDLWKYRGWSCYDVLIDVLSVFQMQVVSFNGLFSVRLIDEPREDHYNEYTYRGTNPSRGTKTESTESLYDDFDGAMGSIKLQRPVRKLIFKEPRNVPDNLCHNGDFKLGADGWEGYRGMLASNWYVNNTLVIKGSQSVGVGVYAGVSCRLDRGGTYRGPIKVEFEARRFDNGTVLNGETEMRVQINIPETPIAPNIKFEHIRDDFTPTWLWQKCSCVIQQPVSVDGSVVVAFVPYTPALATRLIGIRNVVITPCENVTGDVIPLDSEEIETERDVSETSLQDLSFDIGYPYGGSPYKYENAFPSAQFKADRVVMKRGSTIPFSNYAIQRMRVLNFYRVPRTRLSVDVYCKADSPRLLPYSILFDKYLERNFVIMSSAYDPLRAKYSLELMEYERATTPPLTWILADGTWNDDGYWVDTEQWNDTDPN